MNVARGVAGVRLVAVSAARVGLGATRAGLAIAAVLLLSTMAAAQGGPGAVSPRPLDPVTKRPVLLENVRFDQRLDAQVPADLDFVDDLGRPVRLAEYFGQRPIVLALVYFECPMLCSQVLTDLVAALEVLKLTPGEDFDVVAVSFNHKETPGLAAAKKAAYMERYGRPGTERGFHFLTGTEASIARLTSTVGFKFAWDPDIKQYAHAAGVMVLTPDGRVSKYFYGLEYSPRDLRLGLVEAADRKIGTAVDTILLYCYHYDPATGKYGLVAMRTVQAAGLVLIAGMITFWIVMWRRTKRPSPAAAPQRA
jgi:protein SCO1/2